MALAKTHPCNAFNGWLYVTAEAAREAMDQQLRFRDAELAIDKNASGEPHPMRAWAIGHVKRLARHDPKVAEQINQRRATLLRQLDRLDADEARRALAYHRAVEAVERDLELLDQVDPAAAVVGVET